MLSQGTDMRLIVPRGVLERRSRSTVRIRSSTPPRLELCLTRIKLQQGPIRSMLGHRCDVEPLTADRGSPEARVTGWLVSSHGRYETLFSGIWHKPMTGL